MKKVIVIGAGAAGLMAAGAAAKSGNKVTLIEKMGSIGRKVLITGKGRCNVTNNGDIDDIIANIPGNGEFLYSAFYQFSNTDLMAFLEGYGVKTKVERGNRVFPESDRSADIVNALKRFINEYNVETLVNTKVTKILVENKKVIGIQIEDGRILNCDKVIIATGGKSYPLTGSTGDGYKFAKELGHTVTDLKPSLVPLETVESWIKELQGLSLKNISIKLITNDGKKVYDDFGEMIFTHFGVSGPIILSSSRHLHDKKYNTSGLKIENIKLVIDLKPALDIQKLDDRIQRDFLQFTRKQFKNSLDELLPSKLIPVIIKLSGIDEEKLVNQITKEERLRLVELLKKFTLTIKALRPIEEAIVTSGGVCTDELNPQNMESKLVEGLHFAGEVIDCDGYTGGFNLQIAFSTGYCAGID